MRRHFVAQFDRLAVAAVAIVSAGLFAGCTLTLDLEACESDEDCPEFHHCDDHNLCTETEREYVTSFIDEDTTWEADTTYVLDGMIMVTRDAVLEIEAGTQIRATPESGLVVRAGSRLEAEGTADEPIVFTSDQPVGQRLAGDWAGLALVGRAPTNREDFFLRVDDGDRGKPPVGGDNEDYDCGTLRYVRTEFGGAETEVEIDGETRREQALNGITLAGCGSETTVEYVQTHMSDDDGIAIFGGNVDLRYAVVTSAATDSFNFDTGWHGTAQFIAAQQDSHGNDALEIQNLFEDHEAEPRSNPQIYNFTLIGDPNTSGQVGLNIQRGAKARMANGIVIGHPDAGLFIESAVTAHAVEAEELEVRSTAFENTGPDGEDPFALFDLDYYDEEDWEIELFNHGAYPDYEGFANYGYFTEERFHNLINAGVSFHDDPYDLGDPGWVPHPEHVVPADDDVAEPPEQEGFDSSAVYRGAFQPNVFNHWAEGWTEYPGS